MGDLTIRRLPDELHRFLKQRAEANHRSINRETIALIERAMKDNMGSKPRLTASEVMARASRFTTLPVLDRRRTGEMVEFDADGLPQ